MMNDETKEIIFGRKTFFIAPDVTLFPESYLEDYLNHGYETYIIVGDDHYCPLKIRVEEIIKLFTDSILFFYIDAQVANIDWPTYIYELQKKYGDRVLIGVLYQKRNSEEEKNKLEKYYLYDVGIQCGCIGLEYQRERNFSLIDKVLFVNQAMGRRKTVRAMCDKTSALTFDYKKRHFTGRIADVSLNHFSCTLIDNPIDVPMYERVNNLLLAVNGMHFNADGVLMMRRNTNARPLFIFVFVKADGSQGLEGESFQRLSQKIYQMVTDKAKTLMHSRFTEALKEHKYRQLRGMREGAEPLEEEDFDISF